MAEATKAGDWKEWSQYVLGELKETREEIKAICEQLKTLSETMIKNTLQLDDHMMRTLNVEEINKILLQKFRDLERKEIEAEAVKTYKRGLWIYLGKAFGLLGTIGTAIYYLLEIMHKT